MLRQKPAQKPGLPKVGVIGEKANILKDYSTKVFSNRIKI
jgi:hypothetical protein